MYLRKELIPQEFCPACIGFAPGVCCPHYSCPVKLLRLIFLSLDNIVATHGLHDDRRSLTYGSCEDLRDEGKTPTEAIDSVGVLDSRIPSIEEAQRGSNFFFH